MQLYGDNGIITNAMTAKQKQGMAALEEYLQQKYVEDFEDFEDTDQYINKVELLSNRLTDLLLTNSTSRKYIIYEGKTHYLLNKKSLPQEIQDGLVGGDSDKTEDFSKLIDVYGITTDLRVYYVNTLDGTQYGNMNVEDVNPDLVMPKISSDSVMNEVVREALKNAGVVVDESKGITIDNVSKISKLTIDGTKNNVTNIEALSELLNLQELTLKNITLENLTGIETLGMLNYIYFDNCKINDYSKMASVLKLKYLYFYFPTTMTEKEANSQITNLGNGMENATRIDGLNYLYIMGNDADIMSATGNSGWEKMDRGFFKYGVGTLSNLTDISGLEKLPNNMKSSVIELYLNNHKIKDINCLSNFSGLQNVIMPCNPELHSLNGLEDKTNLLYLAAQQPEYKDETGKIISDMGFENLDGLKGDVSLKYLLLFNNTNLEDISGIKDSSNLNKLYANNCDLSSTSGLEGKNGDGLDNLAYLNLENNVNLRNVSQINKCDKIVELYLAGNINMDETEAIALETIIKRCGSNYSIPQKFSLGFSSVTSQDISGSDFSDSQLENFTNKTNITRLRLQNCTSLSNQKINEVLSTMIGLKYLSLEGTTGLSTINFVNSMKLVQLDINNTSVTDLSPLDGEASRALTCFRLKSKNIGNYQTLLKNLCDNAGNLMSIDKNDDGDYEHKTINDKQYWGRTDGYASVGLQLCNEESITIKFPSNLSRFAVGCLCSDSVFDLSECNNLTNLSLGCPGGSFIFPKSLKCLYTESALSAQHDAIFDFKNCSLLEYIYLGHFGNDAKAEQIFKTLPDKNCVNWLSIKRSTLTNLNFLKNFNTSSLRTLIISGWSPTESICKTFTTTSGIGTATGLTAISIKYTYLKDLTGLENLTNLLYLDLQYNKLDNSSQVSNIANCNKLITLILNNNQISTIEFLSSLTVLKTADFSNNSFSQIPNLSSMASLDTLNLSGCTNIIDLSPLESIIKNGTTSLRTLNLQNCTGIESVSSTTGYDNRNLLDKLRNAGCNSITITGTRL